MNTYITGALAVSLLAVTLVLTPLTLYNTYQMRSSVSEEELYHTLLEQSVQDFMLDVSQQTGRLCELVDRRLIQVEETVYEGDVVCKTLLLGGDTKEEKNSITIERTTDSPRNIDFELEFDEPIEL